LREPKVLKLSAILLALVGIGLFLTGVVYVSLDRFMPYHGAALQVEWSDLDANYQGLLLGLIRGLGGGALIVGFAIFYMAGASLRRDAQPYLVLLPSVAVGYSALLCFATYTVHVGTPGDPPLLLNIVNVIVSTLASTMFVLSQRDKANV